VKLFEGEHEGFVRRAGVVHRRAILLVDGRMWVVVDDLVGAGEHDLSAQWLFPGARVAGREGSRFRLETPAGSCSVTFVGGDVETVEGDAATTRGWFSPKYQYREPALGLVVVGRSRLPARRVTVVSLGEDVAIEEASETRLAVGGLAAEWRPFPYRASDSLVAAIEYNR
jgi:hypothetical protein